MNTRIASTKHAAVAPAATNRVSLRCSGLSANRMNSAAAMGMIKIAVRSILDPYYARLCAEQPRHSRVDHVDNPVRVQPSHDRYDDQRRNSRQFAQRDLQPVTLPFFTNRALEQALNDFQGVRAGEYQADHRQ